MFPSRTDRWSSPENSRYITPVELMESDLIHLVGDSPLSPGPTSHTARCNKPESRAPMDWAHYKSQSHQRSGYCHRISWAVSVATNSKALARHCGSSRSVGNVP